MIIHVTQTVLRHPRWKWVIIFSVCEVISILSVFVSLQPSSMAWIGGIAAAFFAPGMAVAILQLAKPRPVFRIENEFVIRRSSWTTLAYLSICAGWFFGSLILLAHRPDAAWIAWALIYLCAFGAFVSLVQFLDRRPLMVINDNGVKDRTYGNLTIPWKEISGASIQTLHGTDVIALDLKNPQQLLPTKSLWQRIVHLLNRAANVELLHLGLVRLDSAYIDQALDFILAKSSEAQSELADSSANNYEQLLSLADKS